MSKRNWFIVTTAPRLAALTGVCLILAAGCEKKKADGEGGAKPAAGAADKGGGDAAMPGVTATEIKIGQTMPYSGPASAYSVIGKTEAAYFKWLNDKGGVNGRKINLVSLDDGYSPTKAVEQIKKLVENEGVAFTFNTLGTPSNTAIQKYLNDNKVPQLFVATGADKWGNPKDFPWTMGWQPSYRTEAQIYAKYIMKEKPGAKMCVLYQNDDFGKDYVKALKDQLGDKAGKMIVAEASYESTDPSVDSQIATLKGSGADTLFSFTSPKFSAQAIRKSFDIGWRPLFFLPYSATSVSAVLQPAGLDKSEGLISSAYVKDPTDPQWRSDAATRDWLAWRKQYYPEGDVADLFNVYAYTDAQLLIEVLRRCGDELTRENVMKQAANLKNLELPMLLPGVTVNTSATDYDPIKRLQLMRFDGKQWVRFGDVVGQ